MGDGKRVLIYSAGQDTGGQGHRIGQAFHEYAPDWRVDVLNDSPSSLGYPESVLGQRMARHRMAASLYGAADVVHLRNNLRGWQQLDHGQGKPVLLHHHGTHFRETHGALSQAARQIGAVEVASTVDLTLLEPGVTWLPSPYDRDWLARLRADAQVGRRRGDGILRVAHLPTSARKKQSAVILSALRQLQSEGHKLEIITNVDALGKERHMPWPQALWHKAQADVYVDQLLLGYGNNAVEAWGMGMPVVAGVGDDRVRARMVEMWGHLPFVEATPDTAYTVLRQVVTDPGLRSDAAAVGAEHFDRWHASARVVSQLQALYLSCQPTHTVPVYASPGWRERQGARERARAERIATRRARTAAAGRQGA